MLADVKTVVKILILFGLFCVSGCLDDGGDQSTGVETIIAGAPVMASCSFDGQTFNAGDRFEAGDGCNRCVCESDGRVACTEIGCNVTVLPCRPDECGPAPATAQRLCPDGVNYEGPGSCQRGDDGVCGYLNQVCPAIQPPKMDEACAGVECDVDAECRDGRCVEPCETGTSFPAADGCNTCVCPESGNAEDASCTDTVCSEKCVEDGDCDEQSYCDFTGNGCGLFGQKGTCQPRQTECFEPGGIPTCGCDGTLALNDCELANRGTDVSTVGGCETDGPGAFACGDQTCEAGSEMCSVTQNEPGENGRLDLVFVCVPLPELCEPGECDCAGFDHCVNIGGQTFVLTPGD